MLPRLSCDRCVWKLYSQPQCPTPKTLDLLVRCGTVLILLGSHRCQMASFGGPAPFQPQARSYVGQCRRSCRTSGLLRIWSGSRQATFLYASSLALKELRAKVMLLEAGRDELDLQAWRDALGFWYGTRKARDGKSLNLSEAELLRTKYQTLEAEYEAR